MYWTTGSGYIELNITKKDAAIASHPGRCDADVTWLRENRPYITRQLAKLDPEKLRLTLAEYGAWSAAELADHESNLDRVLWIACSDIAESLV